MPDLEDLAQRILSSPLVAVDTESDSLYSYNEKICLVQFSLLDEDFIVDPLTIFSLEPLADVFASPRVEKVFHGADYDLVSLKRGYGFHFANIFDTMLAARILGRKRIGLAALVADHLGLLMDKSQQRSDWGRRPLSTAQLAYACQDTRYLFPLHDLLLAELQQTGREQEAREAFAELANLEPKPHVFDPDAFWHIKGVRDLDSTGKRIVRALYRWREDQARWEDRPPFKVMSNKTLVALGKAAPSSFDDVRRRHLLSEYQLMRYGHHVMEVVGKARHSDESLEPPRQRNGRRRPDEMTLDIYQSLRVWRKERAADRGVEPDVIASNDVLMSLASRRPQTERELESIPGLGASHRAEYGPDIIAVIGRNVA